MNFYIKKEEDRWNISGQISYTVETLCDIPAGEITSDNVLVKAYQEVIKYMGETPTLDEGLCCNANAVLSVGKPAVCMGGGSSHSAYIHSLNERFYTVNAYKQSQCALLLILMMAGLKDCNSIFD